MILNESLIVPLDEIDKTKQVGLKISADNLPIFGRFFAHEGFKILNVENNDGFIKFYMIENMNRSEVSYDVKVVQTGYKVEPLDEYIDSVNLDGYKAHVFIQHSHPPRRKK